MNKYVAVGSMVAIMMSAVANAETMQHWANIRDAYGNIVGIASEGDGVTVTGWDANGRIQIYDCNTGITGSVAPVYLYGGTDYQYENPGYYSYEQPGTYDGYYQEYDYDYNYDQYYTGTPTYDPNCWDNTQDTASYSTNSYDNTQYNTYYTEPVYDEYVEPTYVEPTTYSESVPQPVASGYRYVDVDITNQTVSVYDGTTLLASTYCVTGNYGTNDTPVGTHYILNKKTNAVLYGDNSDGSSYEQPVSYWMPFTASGCGLHDASWRYDFSTGAYYGNGTHGCVNLTYGDAANIYNLVDVGTPVVVHY